MACDESEQCCHFPRSADGHLSRIEAGFAVPGLGDFGAANLNDIALGAKGTLAIRPERVELHRGNVPGRLPVTIAGLAYLGQDLILHLQLEGRTAPLIARVPAANPISAELKQGLTLWCDWPAEHSLILSE